MRLVLKVTLVNAVLQVNLANQVKKEQWENLDYPVNADELEKVSKDKKEKRECRHFPLGLALTNF